MARIKTLAAALAVGALGFASSAFASDICAPGYHETPWHDCRPNHGPVHGGYDGYGPYGGSRPVYGSGYGRIRVNVPGLNIAIRTY